MEIFWSGDTSLFPTFPIDSIILNVCLQKLFKRVWECVHAVCHVYNLILFKAISEISRQLYSFSFMLVKILFK